MNELVKKLSDLSVDMTDAALCVIEFGGLDDEENQQKASELMGASWMVRQWVEYLVEKMEN